MPTDGWSVGTALEDTLRCLGRTAGSFREENEGDAGLPLASLLSYLHTGHVERDPSLGQLQQVRGTGGGSQAF